jgi:hypothetical protein
MLIFISFVDSCWIVVHGSCPRMQKNCYIWDWCSLWNLQYVLSPNSWIVHTPTPTPSPLALKAPALLIADGSGVPPGTVPQTCKACRGAGVVCLLLHIWQSIVTPRLLSWHSNVVLCIQIFYQKGILSLESTCSRCGGSGKVAKVHLCFKDIFCLCVPPRLVCIVTWHELARCFNTVTSLPYEVNF